MMKPDADGVAEPDDDLAAGAAELVGGKNRLE
jgi:hypothetical protein